MQAPWVMVQAAQKFVAPCELVFDIEEDLDHRELPLCGVVGTGGICACFLSCSHLLSTVSFDTTVPVLVTIQFAT